MTNGNFYKSFGLLMAFPFQVISVAFAAHWFGVYLDKEYPKSFSWLTVTYIIASIVILQFFIFLIMYIIKLDKSYGKSK